MLDCFASTTTDGHVSLPSVVLWWTGADESSSAASCQQSVNGGVSATAADIIVRRARTERRSVTDKLHGVECHRRAADDAQVCIPAAGRSVHTACSQCHIQLSPMCSL